MHEMFPLAWDKIMKRTIDLEVVNVTIRRAAASSVDEIKQKICLKD